MKAGNKFHERDCAACDAARAVVTAIAEQLDPLDNWAETEVDSKGTSVEQAMRTVVAGVLHSYPGMGPAR